MLLTLFLVSDQQETHTHQSEQVCNPLQQVRRGKTTYRQSLPAARHLPHSIADWAAQRSHMVQHSASTGTVSTQFTPKLGPNLRYPGFAHTGVGGKCFQTNVGVLDVMLKYQRTRPCWTLRSAVIMALCWCGNVLSKCLHCSPSCRSSWTFISCC
jgi:hypothetical protein